MFTGIIEALGTVKESKFEGENIHFLLESPISSKLKIDQSLSHNGVCLTVVGVKGDCHRVTAVRETLLRSTFGGLVSGDLVNLERSLRPDSRLDGHLVQGHVDCIAECLGITEAGGSHYFEFNYPESQAHLLIPKGSIAVNGVSLTIAELGERRFSVAVIPYTFKHTTFSRLRTGMEVNLEFDLIGKYVHRHFLLEGV